MDTTIDDNPITPKHPLSTEGAAITRPVAATENQSSHSTQAVDTVIGEVAIKQFSYITQDRDNSAIVYTHGDLAKRVRQNPSTKSYVYLLVQNPHLWQKWVQNEYEQVLKDNAEEKERQIAAAYWDHIKDNFYALLKRLRPQ